MDLPPEERAALEAEWAKGAALSRKGVVAILVSSAVLGIFMVPAIVFLSPRLMILALGAGVPLGMLVRKRLMPKGSLGADEACRSLTIDRQITLCTCSALAKLARD